jgi:exopolysaccharide biosynthesis polyprenyl glycosylphosphotransferase
MRTILLLVGDALALFGAFWLMLLISYGKRLNPEIISEHGDPFLILGAIWILILFLFNLYDSAATRPTIGHLWQIFAAFITAGAVGMIFFYAIPYFGITPKTNLLVFSVLSLLLFILWRRLFYSIFSANFLKDSVFISAGGRENPLVDSLVKYISLNPQSGFRTAGVYESLEEFFGKYSGKTPDIFIVAKEIWRKPENFKKLYGKDRETLDLAYAYEDILGRVPCEAIDEDWFMHNIRSDRRIAFEAGNRILDIIISSIILILTSPLSLITAIAIKSGDGGPVLYSQARVGRGGKNFTLYKFRSMHHSAEKNPDQAGAAPAWSYKEDPRVTPVGKFIRRLHWDELPQMWNVLRGDIALVGPRPERPEFVAELERQIPFYHLRHIITPGFTGWAQIKFRYAGSVMDSKEKFEYDLYYLKNRNIFMDLGILVRTLQIIFMREPEISYTNELSKTGKNAS